MQNTYSLHDFLMLSAEELENTLAAELDNDSNSTHHFSHRYKARKQLILNGNYEYSANRSYRRRLILLFVSILALLTAG